MKRCTSSKWGVEKSILSEQWKVEGDDLSVSCESRREESPFLAGTFHVYICKDKNHTPLFSVFMFNHQ